MATRAIIRAGHRTMYFGSRELAIAFLESTKQWQVEEWTMDEETEMHLNLQENQFVERIEGPGDLEVDACKKEWKN